MYSDEKDYVSYLLCLYCAVSVFNFLLQYLWGTFSGAWNYHCRRNTSTQRHVFDNRLYYGMTNDLKDSKFADIVECFLIVISSCWQFCCPTHCLEYLARTNLKHFKCLYVCRECHAWSSWNTISCNCVGYNVLVDIDKKRFKVQSNQGYKRLICCNTLWQQILHRFPSFVRVVQQSTNSKLLVFRYHFLHMQQLQAS